MEGHGCCFPTPAEVQLRVEPETQRLETPKPARAAVAAEEGSVHRDPGCEGRRQAGVLLFFVSTAV
jgi:hypothetical protein